MSEASPNVEKVKTQNILRPQDIDKIISTNRTYTKSTHEGGPQGGEDKYSYVAPLEEVRENDYNLNIPRYVDTFEEEEPCGSGSGIC